MNTKVCSKCKIKKDISKFYKGKDKRGLQYKCKSCCKKYNKNNSLQQKQWRKNNALWIIEQGKQYRKDNTSQITKRKKQWQRNNASQIAKRKKQYIKNNALFKTYSKNLEQFEEVRICPKNQKLLEVRCAYCGKWFRPTNQQVSSRIQAFKGNIQTNSENHFYCSENCKIACPTYKQRNYPKGFKKATPREVVPLLRQLVLERDNYTCQKCGATVETAQLHVHHEKSYTLNKIMANDPDNCITLCKKCHKQIHSQNGCNYFELRCQKKKEN